MAFVIDNEPPPEPSLREAIEALEAGQSVLAKNSPMGSVRTTVSRVRAQHPERRFKTGDSIHGPRVWRTA